MLTVNPNGGFERKNKKDMVALYKSSEFCSLISILRYVKIQKISYLMSPNVVSADENNLFKFKELDETLSMIQSIPNRIPSILYNDIMNLDGSKKPVVSQTVVTNKTQYSGKKPVVSQTVVTNKTQYSGKKNTLQTNCVITSDSDDPVITKPSKSKVVPKISSDESDDDIVIKKKK